VTLDTSVLYDGLVDGPLSGHARALLAADLILRAPDLLNIEIAGAVTRAVRRQEIEPDAAEGLLARAQRIAPEVDPSARFIDRAFTLSLELAHPLADCVFLAHAEARADVLVTSDARFARKVAASRHARSLVYLADWRP
jgi:predicted nucleic acid-binding protein